MSVYRRLDSIELNIDLFYFVQIVNRDSIDNARRIQINHKSRLELMKRSKNTKTESESERIYF